MKSQSWKLLKLVMFWIQERYAVYSFGYVFLDHTSVLRPYLGLYTQGSVMMVQGGPYVVPGIELRTVTCKASILLYLHYKILIAKIYNFYRDVFLEILL